MAVMIDDDPASSNNQAGMFGIEIEATTKVRVRNIWSGRFSEEKSGATFTSKDAVSDHCRVKQKDRDAPRSTTPAVPADPFDASLNSATAMLIAMRAAPQP